MPQESVIPQIPYLPITKPSLPFVKVSYFAEGDYQLLMADDPDVFAYKRTWKDQTLYVICNFRAKKLNEVIPEEYRKEHC